MIDRETTIQWANEAGMINFGGANWQCVTDQIQQIITRAQSEAYEAAAKRSDAFVYMSLNFETLSQEIRSMKQSNGEKT